MSGIAGVWNLDGQTVRSEILQTMGDAIAHRGRDADGCRIDGAIGFLCRHLWNAPEGYGEVQPLVSQSGTMLVMDGRLDNRDDLLSPLGIPPDGSDAALVLAAYERWDDRFAEHLSGDFAVAMFDPPRRQLLLARDPVGVRPLYYYSDGRLFAFASEIKALLVHPAIATAPDDEGLADYLMNSARPLDRQERTCFRGISALVPAHVAEVSPDRLSVRRYWDFDTGRAITLRTFDDYADAFRELFERAVKRRLRSKHPVAVAVSGGLDSSSIFCQAETLRRSGAWRGGEVVGISYVSDLAETDERNYLLDIERQYGSAIERFPIELHTGLAQDASRQIRAAEAPIVDYLFGITRELQRRVSARGARTLLSGHWGDQVLFSSAYLVDLFNELAWATIWRHSREYIRYFSEGETRVLMRRFLFDAAKHHVPHPLLSPLKRLRLRWFPPQPPKTWYSESFMANALRHKHRLARLGNRFHSAHARAVYLEARSKYHVHCMELNNKIAASDGLEVAFPFLDRDLLSFLMAIPGKIHARDGVPRVLLREAMRGVLPEPIRARTWKSDFTPFVNSSVAQDASAILQTLSANALGARLGYFDTRRLEPELARLAKGLGTPGSTERWDLADTFGFEVWLQLFLKPPTNDSPRSQSASP